METTCFSKMLVFTYETTVCQNPRQHQHNERKFVLGATSLTTPALYRTVSVCSVCRQLKEREVLCGKTLERWTMASLLSCTRTGGETPTATVQLTFDTVRCSRQERVYVMDEKDAQVVIQSLHHLNTIFTVAVYFMLIVVTA
jgi:hypothetical protein